MYLLGMDVGYSNLCVAAGAPERMAVVKSLPAGAGLQKDMPDSIGGGKMDDGILLTVDNERWVAGIEPKLLTSNPRQLHSDYTETNAYNALAVAGISLGEENSIRRIVTGLPVNLLQNKPRRERLKQLLRGSHKLPNGRVVQVDKVAITAQPLGAFEEAKQNGGDSDLLNHGRVAVVDSGFYSFDWTLIDANSVRPQSSGTSLLAMSRVIEAVDSLVAREHGESPGSDAIEASIRSGATLYLYGQKLDLQKHINDARRDISERALSEMRRSYRDERPIDLFVITGGGAPFFREAVERSYPRSQVYISSDPCSANAQGYWYMAGKSEGAF